MSPTEFLQFLLAGLVQHSESIEIIESQDELGTLLLLRVDPSDMGLLIGRGGKTIDSVRTVLKVFATKSGIRMHLRIMEDTGEPKISV